MTKTKIGSLEAIMLVLTIVISHSFLALPNDILTNYNSASIINIIYVSIFALLLVLLIVSLFKKFPGMDIIDISEYAGGKILKNLIGIVFITYFIVSSGFILRIFCESIKIIYYPMTNITFLIALFVIAVCIANSLNFNATIKEKNDIPIIFLTAQDEETSIVLGLDLGADDYIVKPFRTRELISRIKSVLRRYGKKEENNIIQYKDIKIDTISAKVYKNNKEIIFTSLEYRILLMLFTNQNKLITREQLLEKIWDIAGNFVNDNTLTVYIKRIREKLEDDSIIKTVRGLGYRIGD